MPLGFFTRTRGGEVQSRLTNDVNGMQGVVTGTATQAAANLTTVVGTAVAMVALSWRLSLLTLIVLPLIDRMKLIAILLEKLFFITIHCQR